MTPPLSSTIHKRSLVRDAGSPDIYASKQEQPDNVDEVPIPGREFEAEVLFRREVTSHSTKQADDQENRADDDVRAMESGRHEEGGAIDVSRKVKMGMRVFVGLNAREGQAKEDGENQTPLQSLPIILEQCMVRPGYGGA